MFLLQMLWYLFWFPAVAQSFQVKEHSVYAPEQPRVTPRLTSLIQIAEPPHRESVGGMPDALEYRPARCLFFKTPSWFNFSSPAFLNAVLPLAIPWWFPWTDLSIPYSHTAHHWRYDKFNDSSLLPTTKTTHNNIHHFPTFSFPCPTFLLLRPILNISPQKHTFQAYFWPLPPPQPRRIAKAVSPACAFIRRNNSHIRSHTIVDTTFENYHHQALIWSRTINDPQKRRRTKHPPPLSSPFSSAREEHFFFASLNSSPQQHIISLQIIFLNRNPPPLSLMSQVKSSTRSRKEQRPAQKRPAQQRPQRAPFSPVRSSDRRTSTGPPSVDSTLLHPKFSAEDQLYHREFPSDLDYVLRARNPRLGSPMRGLLIFGITARLNPTANIDAFDNIGRAIVDNQLIIHKSEFLRSGPIMKAVASLLPHSKTVPGNGSVLGMMGSTNKALSLICNLHETPQTGETLYPTPHVQPNALAFHLGIEKNYNRSNDKVSDSYINFFTVPQTMNRQAHMFNTVIDSTHNDDPNWRHLLTITWLHKQFNVFMDPIITDVRALMRGFLSQEEQLLLDSLLVIAPTPLHFIRDNDEKATDYTGMGIALFMWMDLSNQSHMELKNTILTGFLGSPKTVRATGLCCGVPLAILQSPANKNQKEINISFLPSEYASPSPWIIHIDSPPPRTTSHALFLLLVHGFYLAPSDFYNISPEFDQLNDTDIPISERRRARFILLVRNEAVLRTILTYKTMLSASIQEIFQDPPTGSSSSSQPSPRPNPVVISSPNLTSAGSLPTVDNGITRLLFPTNLTAEEFSKAHLALANLNQPMVPPSAEAPWQTDPEGGLPPPDLRTSNYKLHSGHSLLFPTSSSSSSSYSASPPRASSFHMGSTSPSNLLHLTTPSSSQRHGSPKRSCPSSSLSTMSHLSVTDTDELFTRAAEQALSSPASLHRLMQQMQDFVYRVVSEQLAEESTTRRFFHLPSAPSLEEGEEPPAPLPPFNLPNPQNPPFHSVEDTTMDTSLQDTEDL